MSELHRSKLIEFAKKSLVDSGGFGWLTATGDVDEKKNLAAWINFRMTYVFGLEKISGNDSATKYLQHGINAMRNLFHDEVNGGLTTALIT